MEDIYYGIMLAVRKVYPRPISVTKIYQSYSFNSVSSVKELQHYVQELIGANRLEQVDSHSGTVVTLGIRQITEDNQAYRKEIELKCEIKRLEIIHSKKRNPDYKRNIEIELDLIKGQLQEHYEEYPDFYAYRNKVPLQEKVTIGKIEKQVMAIMQKRKVATATEVYKSTRAFKNKGLTCGEIGEVIKALAKKGALRLIPTNKGVKASL